MLSGRTTAFVGAGRRRAPFARMLHTHLPQFVSHFAAAGRHSLAFCHAATRALGIMLSQQQSPRMAFEMALRRVRRGRDQRNLTAPRRKTFPALLLHYHIFKNAGTSFEWALEQALGIENVLHLDKPSHDGYISSRDIIESVRNNPKIKVITSHQAAPPPPRIRERAILSSILIRDPIARIRSIYAFERAQEVVHVGTVRARELDFKGYVEWRLEASPRMFCNFQVYFCCRDRAWDQRMPDSADLDRAIRVLDKIDIVGTVERYDEWLALARAVVGEHFEGISLPSTRQNVLTGERCATKESIYHDLVRDLGPDTARYLLDNNELDICLHQIADALLTRRLAERRVQLSLRETYLTVSNPGEGQAWESDTGEG